LGRNQATSCGEQYDAEDLQDLYQLRALLEGYAARLAASRISDEEVDRLRENCARFEALERDVVRELVKESLLFYNAILEAAGARAPVVDGAPRDRAPSRLQVPHRYSPDPKRISRYFHRQIATALAEHDSERAELIMKEHVFVARDLLVAHLRDLEEGP
jgi:DNA-binding GntR family transcriptional regulator